MRTFSVQENILILLTKLSIVDESDDKTEVKAIDKIQEAILYIFFSNIFIFQAMTGKKSFTTHTVMILRSFQQS